MNWKCGTEQFGALETLESWIFKAPDLNVSPGVSYPEVLWGSVQYIQANGTNVQVYKLSSAILKFLKFLKTENFNPRHSWCRCVASVLCHRSYRSHPSLLLADFVQWVDEKEAPVIINSAESAVTAEAGSWVSVKRLTEEHGVTTTTILPYYLSKIRKILNSETHLAPRVSDKRLWTSITSRPLPYRSVFSSHPVTRQWIVWCTNSVIQ
jgi:hypothetical protein